MALTFTTFDVFTTTPFRGNPLAIVQVPTAVKLSQDQKQLIAREFNLSETVFLHEQTVDDILARRARIDIFTAIAEVAFAGHPTIGTANFLLYHLNPGTVDTLITKAGPVPFEAVTLNGERGTCLAVAHVSIKNTSCRHFSPYTLEILEFLEADAFSKPTDISIEF